MDGSSDDTVGDGNKSDRQLRSHKKSAYGLYKKRPFLPPGVSKNTPKFKYIPSFRGDNDDKLDNARQVRFRSIIQKRPFLPVGKTATSFNVHFKQQTPLWEKALKKRKSELQTKLTQAVKTNLPTKNLPLKPLFKNPTLKLTTKNDFRSFDEVEENPVPQQKPPLKNSNRYMSLARSKLIKSPKMDKIKNCAVSTPFAQLGVLDMKRMGNFSASTNKTNSHKRSRNSRDSELEMDIPVHENKENDYFKETTEQANEQHLHELSPEKKTPGQLRYSLRERRSTPNYSEIAKSQKSSTGKKRKANTNRSKLIQDMNLYQERHMNESDAVRDRKGESRHNLFSSAESASFNAKSNDSKLVSPLRHEITESKTASQAKKLATNTDTAVTNDESDGGSWFYPPSPMDDIIVNKRRSHYQY